MANSFVSFIKFSHLAALGLEREHFYFILITLGAVISFIIIHPFVQWFVALQSTRLLSYVISTLVLLIIFLVMGIFISDLSEILLIILKLMLQSLAMFGGVLILYYSVRRLIGKT
ncbi:hypothetical protein [Oceanobacillus salinisoli]|uniref:hypothetical protein n=1 Tax=Oceanobacillus salinisoli TaxID=2678611 RepID=UPI0012E13A8D|nr:hypothetical protein [Oceanobacillus salinisoli]